MEIRLEIKGTLPERELAALSRELTDEIYRFRVADKVAPVRGSAPQGAKGFVDDIGSLLVSVPVEAITGILGVIKAIASRPGQPPFTMKITRESVEVTFDPRRITTDEVAKLAAQLRPPE